MSWVGHGSRLRFPIVCKEKTEKGRDIGTILRDIELLYNSDDVINHKPCTLLKYITNSLLVNWRIFFLFLLHTFVYAACISR
jgi:hypothetical protein